MGSRRTYARTMNDYERSRWSRSRVHAELCEIEAFLQSARARRAVLIDQALSAGWNARLLAETLNVSRATIYRLRAVQMLLDFPAPTSEPNE